MRVYSSMQDGEIEKKSPINLLRGWPNPSLLPVAQIKAASAAALSQPDVSRPGLLYGPDPGYEPLRESIVFSDPIYTKFIWQVSPTYFRVCPIFEDNAFHGRLRSVPEDEEGIDVEFLRRRLQEVEVESSVNAGKPSNLKGFQPWRKIYRHIIYAVPTFSNPSSRTMTLRRRKELVQVARQYDALVITDDVYDQLQWPAQKPSTFSSLKHAVLPRLVDIDRKLQGGTERQGADGFGNTVSNGSFSKIAAPGTRCGWAEGTEKLAHGLSQCGGSASGGAPSQMTSTFMTELLQSGELENHIFTTLQPVYARRYYKMVEAIERYLLPLGVTLPQSNRTVVGGYFLWFALPKPLLADEVAQVAREDENLIIGQGSLFAVYGDERTEDLERQVRVCFSWEEEANIAQGIERIGKVINRMRKGRRSSSNSGTSAEMAAAKANS
ncbi:MAG: hypothetical protein LQ346_001584 [Caloplaca aetnensis]|nr:MAG: hypothetical protein LQ346_001584 [Caloplaca aetnensis]